MVWEDAEQICLYFYLLCRIVVNMLHKRNEATRWSSLNDFEDHIFPLGGCSKPHQLEDLGPQIGTLQRYFVCCLDLFKVRFLFSTTMVNHH